MLLTMSMNDSGANELVQQCRWRNGNLLVRTQLSLEVLDGQVERVRFSKMQKQQCIYLNIYMQSYLPDKHLGKASCAG